MGRDKGGWTGSLTGFTNARLHKAVVQIRPSNFARASIGGGVGPLQITQFLIEEKRCCIMAVVPGASGEGLELALTDPGLAAL